MAPHLPFALRMVRTLLRRLNYHLSPSSSAAPAQFDPAKLAQAEAALRSMKMPDTGAQAYLEKHIPRLARTLALVPPPTGPGRALELGCYMQLTPLLDRLCGYNEVRGAYYGEPGTTDHKTMDFPDRTFTCLIDHFDAERDPFPYPDGHFDLVLAGEIIEHMIYDPLHLLVESRRVLRDGGTLVLTTPNVASVTSAAKVLNGEDNPQIYFLYKKPVEGEPPDIGHMREYTAAEIGKAVEAAGFEVTRLFTTHIGEFASHLPLLNFLAENGYPTEHRGEQTWCVARKNSALPVDRFPWFIYE